MSKNDPCSLRVICVAEASLLLSHRRNELPTGFVMFLTTTASLPAWSRRWLFRPAYVDQFLSPTWIFRFQSSLKWRLQEEPRSSRHSARRTPPWQRWSLWTSGLDDSSSAHAHTRVWPGREAASVTKQQGWWMVAWGWHTSSSSSSPSPLPLFSVNKKKSHECSEVIKGMTCNRKKNESAANSPIKCQIRRQ